MRHLRQREPLSDLWQCLPYDLLPQQYQLVRHWWGEATDGVEGASRAHLEFVDFMNGQVLDLLSPDNLPITDREFIGRTVEERGANLRRGLRLFASDLSARVRGREKPVKTDFIVGENVAISPGKVIFRNELIELIQYSPATGKVSSEPVLIVPPWIMKYYILDLSPKNSLVNYLVEQGKTVFMISWKNPQAEDREVAFNDYLEQGFLQAMDAVSAVVPGQPINTVGYCIGGTLLLIGAAFLAREGDRRINSVSLFAAQGDFSEAGEIRRFLSDSQLAFLQALMNDKGYLPTTNMGGAFQSLRASDLVYKPARQRYLLGDEAPLNDLMSWNADGTRMPCRMHSEYLRKLYLDNDLAEGRYRVAGAPVYIGDINAPVFAVGTETDHVAPWHSVYKLHGLVRAELTFLLTSGGHNAGIISGPSHPRRRHRVHTQAAGDLQQSPEQWYVSVPETQGSWWPTWYQWLDQHSSGAVKPPRMGAPSRGYRVIADAPGQYVFG
jgi:polyhydroxyalkanoate synthase